MTLLISMVTRSGIFMIADSLEVEDTIGGVKPVGTIDKLDRVENLDVVLSFWGTIANPTKNFELMDELRNFEEILEENDNVLTVAAKIKDYFENLAILDENDYLGFHICGYIDDTPYIHHVHHIPSFRNNEFNNEDSKQEFCGESRVLEYPILFNGDNKIPNLIVNLIVPFNDQIRYWDFNNEKAKNFLIFLMDTAIKLQKYSSRSLTLGNLIDYPLRFCEITSKNIRLEIIKNS